MIANFKTYVSNLKKLTIIIPSFNRPTFLMRTLRYWSGKGVQIICIDGSFDKLNDQFISSLNPNIVYNHLPNSSFKDRMLIANEKISTEFTLFHADDEFHIPSGLSECINVIENEDLVACIGRCLEFSIENKKINGRPWRTFHTSFEGYSIMDNSPIVRILSNLNPYLCSISTSVIKTSIYKNAISFYKRYDLESNLMTELIFSICVSFQGKSKVVNNLSWIRSLENPPHRLKVGKPNSSIGNFTEFLLDSKFRSDPLIGHLSNYLCTINPKYNQDDLEDVIFSAFRAYARQASLSFKIANLYNNNDIPLSAEKRILQETIGTWCDRDFYPPNVLNLEEAAAMWQKKGIDSDVSEIQEIQDLIFEQYYNL